MHEPAQERIDGPAVEGPCGPEPEPSAVDASDAFWDRLIAEERADEEAGRTAAMPEEALAANRPAAAPKARLSRARATRMAPYR